MKPDGNREIGPTAIVHAAQFLAKLENPACAEEDLLKSGLDLVYLDRFGARDRLAEWAQEAARAKADFARLGHSD